MDVYSLPVPGSGGKTCSQIFEEAGCDTPASPSCGACLGGPKDTYARMNEAQASGTFLQLRHEIKHFIKLGYLNFCVCTRVLTFNVVHANGVLNLLC